ncbi:MAG: hypothetical protein NTZ93_00020 [Candidatus Beckwithbacteria bacterium]|nr:hypothetical protein [Candidatus Beckwithbacteria bacterium]
MPASLSLAYPECHPGVVTSFTPGWISLSKIFRKPIFKSIAEVATVLSLFAAIAVWMFVIPTL